MLEHFTDLDDTLAVGSHPQAEEDIQALVEDHGVRAVVNLQSDDDLSSRGLDWQVLWQLYVRRGVATSRVPIRDFEPRDLARHLDEAVAAVDRRVRSGRKTLVHCNAGLNRSPSVIIAYLVAHRGMGLAEATAWLAERHECVPYPDVLQAWARGHRHPL